MSIIKSVYSFLEEIKKHPGLQFDDDEMLFFRGLSDVSYDMKPSIFRGKPKDTECHAYREIMMEYPERFSRKEHLSNLVRMQHYGSLTRLLDLTRNPLISLYFACEQNKTKNGKVACIKVKKSEVLHHNSDKALMLACIPAFSDAEREEIRNFCENHRREMNEYDIKGSRVMTRLLHEIRSEFPAFEPAIVGEDLLKNYFVATYKDNERMKVQDGAFIICGIQNRVDELEDRAIYIEISGDKKVEILKDLKMLGISNNTIYPDLERTAMAIASDRKVDWVNIYENK